MGYKYSHCFTNRLPCESLPCVTCDLSTRSAFGCERLFICCYCNNSFIIVLHRLYSIDSINISTYFRLIQCNFRTDHELASNYPPASFKPTIFNLLIELYFFLFASPIHPKIKRNKSFHLFFQKKPPAIQILLHAAQFGQFGCDLQSKKLQTNRRTV